VPGPGSNRPGTSGITRESPAEVATGAVAKALGGTPRLTEGTTIPRAVGTLGLIDVVTGVRLAGREAVAGTAAVRAVVLRSSWCARGEDGGHGGGNGKKTKERLHQGDGQGPVGGYAVSSFRSLPGDSISSERLLS